MSRQYGLTCTRRMLPDGYRTHEEQLREIIKMSLPMSYVHHFHTTPLEGKTLFQLLDEKAARFPNKEACVFYDEKGPRRPLTFKQYQEQSQSLAAMMLELGLVRGDQVLVLLPSTVEFVIVHMALGRIGAVAIVMEPHANEAVRDLRAQVSCVIYTEAYSDVTSAVKEVLKDANVKCAIVIGSTPEGDQVHCYDALLQSGKEHQQALTKAEAEVQSDDPALVLFTSGSTGIPKPIQYTHHGFVNSLPRMAHAINASRDTVYFSDAPFDWITGLGILSMVPLIGMTYIAFPPKLALTGHVTGRVLDILTTEHVSDALMLSYFMRDVVQQDGTRRLDLSSLKRIITGGQLLDRALVKQVLGVLPNVSVIVVYAATEFCMVGWDVITAANIDAEHCGNYDVSSGLEMKVVDSEERLVPRGTPGELYIRGAMYLNTDSLEIKGKRHKTSKTPTGWHRTSDWAIITTDNKVRILGRVDNLIKCATESIQPAEIESILSRHDNVDSIIAVGVPDQRLHEVVCACVILKSCFHGDRQTAIAQLNEWCSGKFFMNSLGLSSQPKYFVVLDKFPTTRTGKTDRKALKAIAKEELGL